MLRLTVDFADFPEAARSVGGHAQAWVRAFGSGSIITAADPHNQTIVETRTTIRPEQAREVLLEAGFLVQWGYWSGPGEPHDTGAAPHFVAAVAYKSREENPGLWVDSYSSEPTQQQVLRSLYDEFVEHGELGDVSFDEFVRLAKPTVVIVKPDELSSFVEPKC